MEKLTQKEMDLVKDIIKDTGMELEEMIDIYSYSKNRILAEQIND